MENKTVTCLAVCSDSGCLSGGGEAVRKALWEAINRKGITNQVEVRSTGCFGFCEQGPIIITKPDETFYVSVKPQDADEIIERHVLNGQIVDRLLYREPDTGTITPTIQGIGFYSKQQRRILRRCGEIDPENMDHYLATDGYRALEKALKTMTPESVADEVERAGLRGRGGAGFPAGRKWRMARQFPGARKFVVCNADEGDPGAFMNRSLLEGDPHAVLEGLILAGYAVGAQQGYVYIRSEYPRAVRKIEGAIRQAYAYGFLGKNIYNTGFDFNVETRLGAGAFVCGEETALMQSIEGKRGNPMPRPPFPAEKGLWGYPTTINNVETLANVGPIILYGAEWLNSIGTETSKGTKTFALAGKVHNTGLIEVPLGISLREVIYDIGGGIQNGKAFKLVQIGGPSGGCVPAEHLDKPLDYESLRALGAMVGSGGLVVMDEENCVVDVAHYFLSFIQAESCGKCPPCRLGTKQMLNILNRIRAGEGEPEDIARLERLSEVIRRGSLCALGQTAANPVLTTLRYFRAEYEAHIFEKRCPAGVCKPLVRARCTNACPAEVDIPSYLALIAEGRYAEGLEIHRRQNPFALICGGVCPAFCEERCRRAELDEPIAIRAVKRFMADREIEVPWAPPIDGESKSDRVAVVGSGPAGLTAALRLAQMGYQATVFEKLPVAGGMMAVGIPEFRLAHKTMDQEIDNIRRAGVEIRCNQALGQDFTLDTLFGDGYRAVVLAIGAHKSLKMGIEGEDKLGVLTGVDFLREVALGNPPDFRGLRVGVVGGGNVATDAARTAWRLGASEVHVIYRRRRQEMPAYKEEIEATEAEEAQFHFLTNPVRVLGEDHMTGIECLQQALGDFDRSGRRRPVPIAGSEYVIGLDVLISAIGQEPDQSWMGSGEEVTVQRGGTFTVNHAFSTSRQGVFAVGDAVLGPASVVEAVAQGNVAARAVDQYLRTGKVERVSPSRDYEVIELSYNMDEYAEARRPEIPLLSVDQRRDNFDEIELVMDEFAAREECKRCQRCDLEWLQSASSSLEKIV